MIVIVAALAAFFGLVVSASAQCANGYVQQPGQYYICQPNGPPPPPPPPPPDSTPIAASNITNGQDGSSRTSYTTGSGTYPTNQLIIVSVASIDPASSTVPTVSGLGGTWTQIGTRVDTSGGLNRRVTLFRDLEGPPVGNGALTISFAGHAQTNCAWSVDAFNNVNTSGSHGSAAVVQVVGMNANATNTGVSVTLAALGNAKNAGFGFVRNSGSNSITSGAGLTQLSNQTPVPIVAEWGINKTSLGWTWPSQSVVSVAFGVEIAAAP